MVHKAIKNRRDLNEDRRYGIRDPTFGFMDALRNWEKQIRESKKYEQIPLYMLMVLIVLFLTYIILKYMFFVI